MNAVIGAAIAIFAVAAPATIAVGSPAGAATAASSCSATSGVTVIVDFTHFGGGKIERGCAPGHPSNGLDALHDAGFASAGTAQYGDAFVCRIDGLPTSQQDACAVTPAPTAYWAYWNAKPSDTAWTYSTLGVLDYQPQPGSIEAFAFGSHAQPSISPGAAIPPPPPPTSTPTTPTTRRPTTRTVGPPPTAAPPITAATIAGAPPTSGVPVVPRGSTTTIAPTVRAKPRSTTSTAARSEPSTSSSVHILERSAAGPAAPHDTSGSPLGVILAVVIVGGLGIGAFAFTRARRRRPA